MKTLSTVQKAFVALIIANVIWGAAAPIFKLSLENIPPFTLAFWRFFLGSVLLGIILRKKTALPLVDRKDAIYLFGYAMFGITFNIIFFFEGLKRTLAMNSPIIASSQPILTLLLAILFLREAFQIKKFLGMLLGTLGIIIIVIEPLFVGGIGGSILGNIFLVLATLGAVGQIIVGKKVISKYNPFAFTFWAFLIGAASFLPLALHEYVTIQHLYVSLDWRGYMGIVYGAVFSSTIGYGLFAWGLSKINATDTAIFTYIDPIVGTVLAALLLHEPITTPFVLGSLFIFGGIFIAEGRFHYHPVKKLYAVGRADVPIPLPDEPSVTHHRSSTEKKKILTKIFEKQQ